MWTTVTLVSVAVLWLLVLPDAANGRKRVLIKVPYVIKHIHHHHVKKVRVEKYHPPKEYHIHHKSTYSKAARKRPVFHEEYEYDHGHDFEDFGKGEEVWQTRNEGWKKKNHKRPQKHHEESFESSDQVSYKSQADWRDNREKYRNYKNDTQGVGTTTRETQLNPNINPAYVSELMHNTRQIVPNVAPQMIPNISPQMVPNIAPQLVPNMGTQIMYAPVMTSPYAIPNMPFGISPYHQRPQLPIQMNPLMYRNEGVGNYQQNNIGQSSEILKKPSWEANKPDWDSKKPVRENGETEYQHEKPTWESKRPSWEPNNHRHWNTEISAYEPPKPQLEVNNRGWESGTSNYKPNNHHWGSEMPTYDSKQPAWDFEMSASDSKKPAMEFEMPAHESNKPTWETSTPAWDFNKPAWEASNNWGPPEKDQKRPAFSYSVSVVH